MKVVLRLIFFSILLNLATGLMLDAIPAFKESTSRTGGVNYDSNNFVSFTNTMNGTINPTGDLEDSTSFFDRLLDKLELGVIKKILTVMDQYMFGFINTAELVLHLSTFWVATIKLLITFGYIMGAISLWTEKDIARG